MVIEDSAQLAEANGALNSRDTRTEDVRGGGNNDAASQPLMTDVGTRDTTTQPGNNFADGEDGEPRSANRVRFQLEAETIPSSSSSSHHRRDSSEEYQDDDDFDVADHTAPLLTASEAPSVTVATSREDASGQRGSGDFRLEDLLESAKPKSGMQSAFMNMANSIIGAGIIGQPYAFRQAGLIAGILLLIGLTFLVDWTICLIVINSKMSGADSFQSTVEYCFGRPGLIAVSLAQWAFAFGGMIAFCVIVGDTIPHVLAALFPSLSDTPVLWLLTDRRAVIVLFIFGFSYPLCLYRNVSKLAKASTMALISMFVILVTVITQGVRVPSDERGTFSRPLLTINSGFLQAIGIISFAFVCHHNSLLIYGSLKKPTIDRFARVTHFSTGISMAACLAMALAGFLTFRSETEGNVLNNFPSDNVMVNIARFCFGLNMLTTFPLENFVCREVFTVFFFPSDHRGGEGSSGDSHPRRAIIITTLHVLVAVLCSLLTCDLGIVFEIIGATSACALAYILPPLCYLRLSGRGEHPPDSGYPLPQFFRAEWWQEPRNRSRAAAVACVIFGVAVMVLSLALAALKIVSGGGEGSKTCR